MSPPEGDRTPKMRGGRERLTVHRPPVELSLASITFDGFNLNETRRFGNRLLADAEAWMRRGGFTADRGRIDKATARRMFAHEFGKGGSE